VGVGHPDREENRLPRWEKRWMPEETLATLLVDLQEQGWRSAGRGNAEQIKPREYDGVVGSPGGACDATHRVGDLRRRTAAQRNLAKRSCRRVPETQPLAIWREEWCAAKRTTERPRRALAGWSNVDLLDHRHRWHRS